MRLRVEHIVENGAELKKCGICDNWLPLDKFNYNSSSWDGLIWGCKTGTAHYRSGSDKKAKGQAFSIIGELCVDCSEENRLRKADTCHHVNHDGHEHLNRGGKRMEGRAPYRWIIKNPHEARDYLVPLCKRHYFLRHVLIILC